jgi:Amt family ammonium transporter
VNALLAGRAGLMTSFFLATFRGKRPQPALLCRGLLAGVVSISACAEWLDPWAAFVIGIVAALLVQGMVRFLEARQVDDPTGAAAVHGMGGAWGVLAAGLFANGSGRIRMNDMENPVQGLFFGGAWHQLAAQAIGCASDFVMVFILGYACVSLVQKIVGGRVDLVDEVEGLDWPQTGALGYQSDIEPEGSVDGLK